MYVLCCSVFQCVSVLLCVSSCVSGVRESECACVRACVRASELHLSVSE